MCCIYSHSVPQKKEKYGIFTHIVETKKKENMLYLLTQWGTKKERKYALFTHIVGTKKERKICSIYSHRGDKKGKKNMLYLLTQWRQKRKEKYAIFTHIVGKRRKKYSYSGDKKKIRYALQWGQNKYNKCFICSLSGDKKE